MKTGRILFFYLSMAILLIVTLVIVSCTKHETNVSTLPKNTGNTILKTTGIWTINPHTFIFWAGQNINAGNVIVTEVDPELNGGNNLHFELSLTGSWYTDKIHFWIGTVETGWQQYMPNNGTCIVPGHLPVEFDPSWTQYYDFYVASPANLCTVHQFYFILDADVAQPDGLGGYTTNTNTGSADGNPPPNCNNWFMEASFTTSVTLVVTNPATQCGGTVDLTLPAVTAGSSNGTFNYFTDAAGTSVLSDPQHVSVSGTYYIQAVSPSGCTSAILPVVVTINPLPDFTTSNPPVYTTTIFPVIVNLTNYINPYPIDGVGFTYMYGTNPITNPTAVSISVSGVYQYDVTATNTATGCSKTLPIIVQINTGKQPECTPQNVNTAFGGSIAGSGPAWWYLYDNLSGGSQPISAGNTYNNAGHVIYTAINATSGTITITLTGYWELNAVNNLEPVKIQGYNTKPNKRPPAGQFTTYKGTSTTVTVPYFKYYDIQLDVQECIPIPN